MKKQNLTNKTTTFFYMQLNLQASSLNKYGYFSLWVQNTRIIYSFIFKNENSIFTIIPVIAIIKVKPTYWDSPENVASNFS